MNDRGRNAELVLRKLCARNSARFLSILKSFLNPQRIALISMSIRLMAISALMFSIQIQ